MNVSVLGCGRWASFHIWYQSTVLGNDVLVWGRDDKFFRELRDSWKNEYLTIPKNVQFTGDLGQALKFADYIIVSISAQAMPELCKLIGGNKPQNKTFVLCMKGLIESDGERLSEVLEKQINVNNKIAVWVGPGHVQDLVAGQQNMMIIAGQTPIIVADVAGKFRSKLVRLYESDDIIGCEVGSAVKNVIGIGAGMLDGAGMHSLKGVLMARGAYEVAKLITAMGGNKLTAYGISHLGDYEATLFSANSHNRLYGEKFFKGEKMNQLAEGVPTAVAVHYLAEKYKVDMPICDLVYRILHKGLDINEGFKEILERDNVKEFKF